MHNDAPRDFLLFACRGGRQQRLAPILPPELHSDRLLDLPEYYVIRYTSTCLVVGNNLGLFVNLSR